MANASSNFVQNNALFKDELSKLRKQLSSVFQENCSLKEENGLLRIQRKHLEKQIASLQGEKTRLQERFGEIETQFADCPVSNPVRKLSTLEGRGNISSSMPENLKGLEEKPISPLRVEKLKVLEKRHSSPQFYKTQDSVDEISEQFYELLIREKQELEQQYKQMLEIQRTTDTNPNGQLMSEFSYLKVECQSDEQELLKQVDKCKQNLIAMKNNIRFVNFTIKYLMYYEGRRKEQALAEVPESSDGKHITDSTPSSAPRTLVDSLEEQIAEEKATICIDKPNPGVEVTGSDNQIQDTLVASEYDAMEANFVPRRRSYSTIEPPTNIKVVDPQLRYTVFTDTISKEVPQLLALSPEDRKVVPGFHDVRIVMRSDSAEANVGSPPSSLLTPDSLSSSHMTTEEGRFSPNVTSCNTYDDRVCPMCQAVFPRLMPQTDFEKHVIEHFELEEFELLNI